MELRPPGSRAGALHFRRRAHTRAVAGAPDGLVLRRREAPSRRTGRGDRFWWPSFETPRCARLLRMRSRSSLCVEVFLLSLRPKSDRTRVLTRTFLTISAKWYRRKSTVGIAPAGKPSGRFAFPATRAHAGGCWSTRRPHPEEARSAVSKDGQGDRSPLPILRDAARRSALADLRIKIADLG